MSYAERTKVPVDRSRAEIEKLVMKYGANKFMCGIEENKAGIMFEANNRRIKFILKLPLKSERRTEQWEQECRRLWRSLALNIKAKLEAVESKISTFEEEFMPHIVMPNGQTVSEWMSPQLETAYKTQKMPPLMLE